jgi:hypothetical protein
MVVTFVRFEPELGAVSEEAGGTMIAEYDSDGETDPGDGHSPLRSGEDSKPGETNGQGLFSKW